MNLDAGEDQGRTGSPDSRPAPATNSELVALSRQLMEESLELLAELRATINESSRFRVAVRAANGP